MGKGRARETSIGDKFGKLTVVRFYSEPRKSGTGIRFMSECSCECGNNQSYETGNLKSSKGSRRCSLCSGRTGGLKHGHSYSKARVGTVEAKCYYTWQAMKRRCLSENDSRWQDYGGRGISICSEWIKSYECFLSDIGLPPSMSHQIDRYDNNGNYCKENCHWVTRKENSRNKRNNRLIEISGETKTLAEWSVISGVKYHTLKRRIYRGIEPEVAIKSGKLEGKYFYMTPNGKFNSLSEVAKSHTMSISGVNGKFNNPKFKEWVKHERT